MVSITSPFEDVKQLRAPPITLVGIWLNREYISIRSPVLHIGHTVGCSQSIRGGRASKYPKRSDHWCDCDENSRGVLRAPHCHGTPILAEQLYQRTKVTWWASIHKIRVNHLSYDDDGTWMQYQVMKKDPAYVLVGWRTQYWGRFSAYTGHVWWYSVIHITFFLVTL